MPHVAKPTGVLECDLLTIESFASKFTVDNKGCWRWHGTKDNYGYAMFHIHSKSKKAHRVAFELVGNAVDYSKTLDHICRNRDCVNPAHLEQVDNRENLMRGNGYARTNSQKTHCLRGHALSGDNLGRNGVKRFCKTCLYAQRRKRYAERNKLKESK